MENKNNCKNCETSSCSAKKRQADESLEQFLERQALAKRMCQIKHKILVLSGKGGVGKSTVAANLAVSLSLQNKSIGLLDVDIHGPSIPKLLGIEDHIIKVKDDIILPVEVSDNLKAMSIGFLLSHQDDALIWRGPMKIGVIKQFLKDVDWGELDYLIIDLPPGTGDEPLSVCQLIEDADGAVIITTPQELALADVRKSINFCRKLELPIFGVIENMSGFSCPHCGHITDIFKKGGAQKMCADMNVSFLGRLTIDPELVKMSDSGDFLGQHFPDSEISKAIERINTSIMDQTEGL